MNDPLPLYLEERLCHKMNPPKFNFCLENRQADQNGVPSSAGVQ